MCNFKNIGIYYKVLCFILFFLSIMLIDSFISLLFLTLLFYFLCKEESNFISSILIFLTLLSIISCDINSSLIYMKIMMLIDLCYVFSHIITWEEFKSIPRGFNYYDNVDNQLTETEYIRFAKANNHSTFMSIMYNGLFVISNVAILIVSLMVG